MGATVIIFRRWTVLIRNVTIPLLLCVLSRAASAGLGEIDPSGEGVFTEYHCSVIVAKVQKLWRVTAPDGDVKDHAILLPLATIAGTFDASLHPSLPVEFYSDGVTSSIKSPSKQGATVLAVIRYQVLVRNDSVPRNLIVSEVCKFMPDRSALVTVDGLNDPVVTETLHRIQAARAHSGSNTRPTLPETRKEKRGPDDKP
jgi:hypothetical protein